MAKLFVNNGDYVCGISLDEEGEKGVYHQKCDISNEEQIKECVKNVLNKYQTIDFLINNAGFGVFGPIEETSLSKAKKLIDVNLLGAFNLTKTVLPTFRKNNKGKIFITSSIGALLPLSFHGFYSTCKVALDMMFDSLRVELMPYNITITSIKPGDDKTNFTKNRQHDPVSDAYKKEFDKCLKRVEKDEQGGVDSYKIAHKVYKLSFKKHPKYSVKVGAKDFFLIFVYKLLPKRLSSKLLYKIYCK